MTAAPQWFVWRLTWVAAERKYHKVPIWPDRRLDPETGRIAGMDAQVPEAWRTYDQAVMDLALHQAAFDGAKYALGFMFTEGCGYWFLDGDECVSEDQTTWTAQAVKFYNELPGAFCEYSSSGRGLHFFGRGQVPEEHRTRPTREWLAANPGNKWEFYSGKRGACLGLTGQAWGNADTDHTLAVQRMVLDIFPRDALAPGTHLGDGPRADWNGPTDDGELIRRAMASRGGRSALTGSASFADLWTRNVAVLAKTYTDTGTKGAPYGESEADAALIAQLAFWTGCDAARIERLMLQSSLVRPKWYERRGNETWLQLSIREMLPRQSNVLQDAPVQQVLQVATTIQASTTRAQYLQLINEAEDDAQMRNEVIPAIAHDASIETLDRDFLASAIRTRFKEWLFPVSISDCREMVRVRKVEADDAPMVPEWANQHVYVLAADAFFDLKSASMLSRVGFNAQYNRMMPQRPNGDREDAAKWCLERWNVATVTDSMYMPGEQPVFRQEARWLANTYSPTNLPEVAQHYTQPGLDGINAFLRHIQAFCGNRPEVYTNFIDFLAWCVQNPGRKVRYAPLLKGCQGDGKSMLVSALRAAMGDTNVGSIGPALLCADFNDWAEGTCVTGFEEIMITGRKRYSVANNLKEPISNDRLSINRKGTTFARNIVNVTNYLAFTNFVDAVPLEDSDRRWWVIFSPYSSIQSLRSALGMSAEQLVAHFDLIFASMNAQRGEWRKFLTEYQVSEAFRPNAGAPHTAEKIEMRSSGEDAAEAVARQIIEGGAVGVHPSVLSSSALTAAMKTVCVQDGIEIPKTNTLNHMLSRMGFSQMDTVLKWDGKTHRIWWKRGELGNASNEGIRMLLDMSKKEQQLRLLGQ
jgi:hypothetical protein